jgi:hypothetical protein
MLFIVTDYFRRIRVSKAIVSQTKLFTPLSLQILLYSSVQYHDYADRTEGCEFVYVFSANPFSNFIYK